MKLAYDPTENELFWLKLKRLPGFPVGEEIPLRWIVVESDAVYRLDEGLRATGADTQNPLLAVMDTTPMRRGADDLKPLLISLLRQKGWKVEICVLEPDSSGQVHTTMAHILRVKEQIRRGMSVISIGSGVVTDITKHACYLFDHEQQSHTPYLVYQTANSVSAYTSNMAPVLIEGVKRTLDSRYPDALLCDLETLRDAPREMTIAGVGDLLAIYVSMADWYLAYKLEIDPSYTPLPEILLGAVDELLLEHAEAIREGRLEGMALLAKLITLGGLAMSLSHATAPLSGYEHIISHTLDLQNEIRGRPLPLHGTQIALTTVLAATAYQIFIQRFNPQRVHLENCYPTEKEVRERVLKIFYPLDPTNAVGEECLSDYLLKLSKWYSSRSALQKFLSNWNEIKEELVRRVRPPEQIRRIFAAVGGPTRFADLTPACEEEAVKFAFLNAPFIRKRLTLGDLFIFFGWDREALWREVWSASQTPI